MMKCLSACLIAVTAPFMLSALLAAAKLDHKVDISLTEVIEGVASSHLQRQMLSDYPDFGGNSAGAAILGGARLQDNVLQDNVAEKFYSLEAESEASSGWVSLPFAPNRLSSIARNLPVVQMKVARVAQASDTRHVGEASMVPASYVYAYNALRTYLALEERQLTEPADPEPADRYSF